MLNGGARLALVVAAPLLGAVVIHELRGRRAAQLAGVSAIVATLVVLLSVANSLTGSATLEHTFGNAIPGVDFTTRADSASLVVTLVACLAALLATVRLAEPLRLCGVLLCLAGCAAVATAGNLALMVGGVEAVAAGSLMVAGATGAGSRSVRLVAGVLGASGLALCAAAVQLVAGAGSSDLSSIPATTVGGAVAVPWALAGALLVLAAAAPIGRAGSGRDWAAIGTLPVGYLLLLRLQQSAGGQLPGAASVTLAVIGAAAAAAWALAALRARTSVGVGRAVVGVTLGAMVSLFGGALASSGALLAGLFLAAEVTLLAAPAWHHRPTGWSIASLAVLALPGGAAFAALAVGLGPVVHRGPGGFPQLAVLAAALAASAIAAARLLARAQLSWQPVVPGAVIAVVAGLGGGLVPGFAIREVAGPLAGGGSPVDVDAGVLQLSGAAYAGGYVALAALILVVAAAAAAVLVAGEPVAAPAASVEPRRLPDLGRLLALRRQTLIPLRRLSSAVESLDSWLEAQPRLPLFLGATALAIVLFR